MTVIQKSSGIVNYNFGDNSNLINKFISFTINFIFTSHNCADYCPIISMLSAISRIFFTMNATIFYLFKALIYFKNMSEFKKNIKKILWFNFFHLSRATIAFLNFGFLLIIPDIFFTINKKTKNTLQELEKKKVSSKKEIPKAKLNEHTSLETLLGFNGECINTNKLPHYPIDEEDDNNNINEEDDNNINNNFRELYANKTLNTSDQIPLICIISGLARLKYLNENYKDMTTLFLILEFCRSILAILSLSFLLLPSDFLFDIHYLEQQSFKPT